LENPLKQGDIELKSRKVGDIIDKKVNEC